MQQTHHKFHTTNKFGSWNPEAFQGLPHSPTFSEAKTPRAQNDLCSVFVPQSLGTTRSTTGRAPPSRAPGIACCHCRGRYDLSSATRVRRMMERPKPPLLGGESVEVSSFFVRRCCHAMCSPRTLHRRSTWMSGTRRCWRGATARRRRCPHGTGRC